MKYTFIYHLDVNIRLLVFRQFQRETTSMPSCWPARKESPSEIGSTLVEQFLCYELISIKKRLRNENGGVVSP